MAQVPAAKVFSLVVKTIAKPLAKELRRQASANATLKRAVIWMGQSSHKVSTIISVRAAGFTASNIKPLDESKALAIGGDLLSEIFIFSVAGGLLVWDYNNSAAKAAAKAAEAKAQKAEEARQLKASLEAIHARLDEIEHKVYGSGGIWGLGLGIFTGQRPPARPKNLPAFTDETNDALPAAGKEKQVEAVATTKVTKDGKNGVSSSKQEHSKSAPLDKPDQSHSRELQQAERGAAGGAAASGQQQGDVEAESSEEEEGWVSSVIAKMRQR